MSTFLSVYTPTYKRPRLLAQCQASVDMQTLACQQVVVVDEDGIGIDGVYAAIPRFAGLCTGEYVMVLSDDNVLTDPHVAADLRQAAVDHQFPDVLVFKGQVGESVQPLVWEAAPEVEKIDLSCFAVTRAVWLAHAGDWGYRYEGDFDFIRAVWDCGHRFAWWDRLAFRALQIGRGQPEMVTDERAIAVLDGVTA